ncbi:MAG TPA: hypothetical protein VI876_10075 [Dehalococcoidia bacterium]|nr:hypothetical protein [Dehalococcoidia bacterium]
MNHQDGLAREVACWRPWSHLLRLGISILLFAAMGLATGAGVAESAPPSPSPSPSPTPTATTTTKAETAATPTASATATATKAPTATPSPTPSPTPVPAQDLAVVFFNNFCERDQPLMATVFNTSATPLEGRTVRLTLSTESGVLEEHDHYLSLEPLASVNLPLANTARPPWVTIQISLLESPADPNAGNDSSSCGVPAPESQVQETPTASPAAARGSSASGGATADATWRQAGAAAPPQPGAQVQPTRAPARAQTNLAQPTLTPLGDAGGGLAAAPEGGLLSSRSLMLAGVVFLAGGGSWGFYYLTRPPKNGY